MIFKLLTKVDKSKKKILTRQIVVAVFEAPAMFDAIVILKLFLEVETPNMKLILNIIGLGSLKADGACNPQSNNLQFQTDPLPKMAAVLLSLIPT